MAKHLNSTDRDRLEVDFVDRASMEGVLTALEEICFEKADHVESNWGDSALAKAWERVAKAIQKAADKAKNEGL